MPDDARARALTERIMLEIGREDNAADGVLALVSAALRALEVEVEALQGSLRANSVVLSAAQVENERLRSYHRPDCNALLDDESDVVLADCGECTCPAWAREVAAMRTERDALAARATPDEEAPKICCPTAKNNGDCVVHGLWNERRGPRAGGGA
jgi:hypothetical protein